MEEGRSFELPGGMKFKLSKINAIQQFHVVRRIGPLLVELVAGLKVISQKQLGSNVSEVEKFEQMMGVMQPVMTGLSRLKDEDADYVLLRLLSCVEYHQDQFNSWAKVATPTAIAMQDLELPVLLQIAGRALMYNMSGFFALLPRQ